MQPARWTFDENLPSTQQVLDSALFEHPEFARMDQGNLLDFIGRTLTRIGEFEEIARRPLKLDYDAAGNIGAIWIISGVGDYDRPFIDADNAAFMGKRWIAGSSRARLDAAGQLARMIAAIRSGQHVPAGGLVDDSGNGDKIRRTIGRFGPDIIFNGYPSQTDNLAEVLQRPGAIIPVHRAKLIRSDELRVTADQMKVFAYPDNPDAQGKELAIIGHAPQLGSRVLHMLQYYRPLRQESVPYMVPLATPPEGRRESALIETRGLLYYVYLADRAAREPHPYQLLS